MYAQTDAHRAAHQSTGNKESTEPLQPFRHLCAGMNEATQGCKALVADPALYMYQYLLSDDDHDDDHKTYRLHDDEDEKDAEIYFIGQCCETRWFASAA